MLILDSCLLFGATLYMRVLAGSFAKVARNCQIVGAPRTNHLTVNKTSNRKPPLTLPNYYISGYH